LTLAAVRVHRFIRLASVAVTTALLVWLSRIAAEQTRAVQHLLHGALRAA